VGLPGLIATIVLLGLPASGAYFRPIEVGELLDDAEAAPPVETPPVETPPVQPPAPPGGPVPPADEEAQQ
jgi:hypothetical protein